MADIVPTTRGTILRSLIRFVEQELTADQSGRALAALSLSDRELIEEHAEHPRERVSEFVLNRLTVEAAKAKGEALESFGRRAGHKEFFDAIGLYRVFFLVMTPSAMLRKAPALWESVHSHGALSVESEKSSSARIRLARFPSEEAHCARLAGWFEAAGELSGAKNISVQHDVCLMHGGGDCQWMLTWSK